MIRRMLTITTLSFAVGCLVISPLPAQNGHTFGLTLTPLNVGTHSLTAVYSGDANYGAGTSAPVVVTVAPALTQLSLSCSPANGQVTHGNSYSCAANVTADLLLPAAGTLSYTLDGTPHTVALNSQGSAQITVTNPAVGSHTITVNFAAQGNYGASGPVTKSFTVK